LVGFNEKGTQIASNGSKLSAKNGNGATDAAIYLANIERAVIYWPARMDENQIEARRT
jgi:hypothetical protein